MIKRVLILITISLFSCKQTENSNTLFQKVSSEISGVTFQNTLQNTENLNILDYLYFYNGGGVAVGDIDNDGWVDVFFTANQGENKLYRNQGNFEFEDITEQAGVAGQSDWNTGTVMADVNGDGFLDIYVCAVVGIQGLKGGNELFVNNGDGTFTEKGEQYRVNFKNYSTSAAFFDYDNDGDLDMYLLNHAVHTQHSFGKAAIRNQRDDRSGDKLLRNDGDVFVDVSESAGIYGGANGYGLGIATADFNNDGYTDIYISNDFHEDDYYYLNNQNGTFSEVLKEKMGHTSRFSMGSDAVDINHDGYIDIMTLDMIPKDEKVLKASAGDETVDMLEMRTNQLGYHYQYARNMLHINHKGEFFSETALLSGVAESDWSWSALFADYNQDGEQDIFISNGIPKRPNDLDYIRYISNDKIKEKISKTKLVDQEALDIMPPGIVQNMMFQGMGDIQFKDQSLTWLPKDAMISNGSAYADFDNDGDLDIVTNNSGTQATFYKNTVDTTSNYLKLKLRYKKSNLFGIGTKVISYHQGVPQYRQMYTSKGFQSSSEAMIHFGYGKTKYVDSLKIIWPDHTIQMAERIKTNQTLTIRLLNKRNTVDYKTIFPDTKGWFSKVDSIPGFDFEHRENNYVDFNGQKLIPYKVSDKGPATAVGDLNNDDKEDIFFGSSRNSPSQLFIQTNTGFEKVQTTTFETDKIAEDVAAVITDLSDTKTNDLLVASSDGEVFGPSKRALDRRYLYTDKGIQKIDFPELFNHTSVMQPGDMDNDGDQDLFVGGCVVPGDFGKIPSSYILKNENDNFIIQKNEALEGVGMVTDAIWTDFDGDNHKDLIVVGEWMSPTFFKNDNGKLVDVTTSVSKTRLNGLWQSIEAFDMDDDGDLDYVLGNWGLNTKFKASIDTPLRMYYDDFDNNQKSETIVAIPRDGKYYTALGLDELSAQLNFLRKKFTTYASFAGKTVEEVFDKEQLNDATLFEVDQLASGYLKNEEGTFTFVPFSNTLQIAPITSMLVHDFDKDGKEEVLLAGNYFGVTPYHGRFDSFGGALLQKNGKILEANELNINLAQKAVVASNIINFANKEYLIITVNNGKAEIYAIHQ